MKCAKCKVPLDHHTHIYTDTDGNERMREYWNCPRCGYETPVKNGKHEEK